MVQHKIWSGEFAKAQRNTEFCQAVSVDYETLNKFIDGKYK